MEIKSLSEIAELLEEFYRAKCRNKPACPVSLRTIMDISIELRELEELSGIQRDFAQFLKEREGKGE